MAHIRIHGVLIHIIYIYSTGIVIKSGSHDFATRGKCDFSEVASFLLLCSLDVQQNFDFGGS